jgi:NADH:ubiquinone oxidoreductase subunit 3 (subunit A)
VLYRDLSFVGVPGQGLGQGQMSLLGFTEMFTFVTVLVVALTYLWRKKAIGWD